MARAVAMAPREIAASASWTHMRFICFGSLSSNPILIVTLMIAWQTRGKLVFSDCSASFSHMSRSAATPFAANESLARARMTSTVRSLPWVSSSLAAVTQIRGSVGTCLRASLSTFFASWYGLNFASASHISTEVGAHSTARLNMIRASSLFSRLMASFHSFTELGMNSRALRRIFALIGFSVSRRAASSQSFTEWGRAFTALAITAFAVAGFSRRAASTHTSSFVGHCLHPWAIKCRAVGIFPATSSSRAAASHPGPCLGLLRITDRSSVRAFLISRTSASLCTFSAFKSVR
mmetsp:Transcript_96068/g.256702  ORF Transcript_96068/g.256702 Transcript_96068/m.256702 type:complete len:293 (-) Transcript_96068:336-1214(-)